MKLRIVLSALLASAAAASAQDVDTSKSNRPIPDAVMPSVDVAELGSRIKYPEEARKEGLEGKVVVNVFIDTDGTPIKARVSSSDNELFNQPAIDAVMSMTFTPGEQDGKKIRVWASIPITFSLTR
jgi:TonB family protein